MGYKTEMSDMFGGGGKAMGRAVSMLECQGAHTYPKQCLVT